MREITILTKSSIWHIVMPRLMAGRFPPFSIDFPAKSATGGRVKSSLQDMLCFLLFRQSTENTRSILPRGRRNRCGGYYSINKGLVSMGFAVSLPFAAVFLPGFLSGQVCRVWILPDGWIRPAERLFVLENRSLRLFCAWDLACLSFSK